MPWGTAPVQQKKQGDNHRDTFDIVPHCVRLHLAGMRGKLPDVVKLPPSVTVPFSSFEEALKQSENKDMAKRLEAAVKSIPQTKAEEKLRECRDIVMEVCSSVVQV